MNPIQLSNQLKQTFAGYLSTTFNVNRDGNHAEFASALERSLDVEGSLTRGPYLEITPPYVGGNSLQSLIQARVLSPKLSQLPAENLPLPLDVPLYQHQETAIRRVVQDERNIVVSSGTGSGKTESFLIPILNDLLQDPTGGVRALLIYPLNALVNDQLERLRQLLKGTDITFGRYTSELDDYHKDAVKNYPDALPNEIISREQIRNENKIPQILVTNYAMLEYLLLRPEDSELFTQGAWRFLVLDEAHTYSGAKGIEVGMLIRRLKHRLGKQRGELRCIATSATLTGKDVSQAVDFASSLFDEPFDTDDIIFGTIDQHYPHSEHTHTPTIDAYLDEAIQDVLTEMRGTTFDLTTIAIALHDIGLIPDTLDWGALAKQYADNPHGFVWEVMRANTHLIQLRDWMLEDQEAPVEVNAAAEHIFGTQTQDPDAKRQALYHLIELGAFARKAPSTTPLLPARYHLFMRSPQGVWVCVNPHCKGKVSSEGQAWSRVFATPRETCDACECRVYPLSICRECGQSYLKASFENKRYSAAASELVSGETRYLTWENFQENRAFGAEDDPQDDDEADTPTNTESSKGYKLNKLQICVRCGTDSPCHCEQNAAYATVYRIAQINKTAKGTEPEPYAHMNECPRCRSSAQKETEVATPLSVSGMVPLATVTYDLYRTLPPAVKEELASKPGGGRKLLTFYDSRQGAARFAAFLQDIANNNSYTYILPQAVALVENTGRSPSLERISKEAQKLAWEYKIFNNDPTLKDFWRKDVYSLQRSQREKLEEVIQTYLLSEITTQKRRRQSLESLGIMAVDYFDDEELPDFSPLASQLGLTPEQTRTLIEYLLDDIRTAKAISMPEDVEANSEAFGNYQGHPVVIRGGNASSQIRNHQLPWIGKTDRQQRRAYMRLVLEQTRKQTVSEETVKDALGEIFTWLIQEGLFVGSAQEGYRLDHSRLLFHTQAQWYQCQKCQRLNAHGNHLPCPHKHCGGQLEPVDLAVVQGKNYFYNNMHREIVPLRVEEHTAQLGSEKGRQYQEAFQDGDINMLSCSTTFEMGIDLGDLQAVVMSNVPPTVANYRQRAGRAGRRAGGAAFILTWASDRPHDQSYFRNPPDIIRGQVRVPYINMSNPLIQRRHINAILLSQFLRYRVKQGATDWKTLGVFFDEQIANANPHYKHLETWLTQERVSIQSMLTQFAPAVQSANIAEWLESCIADFRADMQMVQEKYSERAQYYNKRMLELQAKLLENVTEYTAEIKRMDGLLKDLHKTSLIDYLSDNGALPSYSFPLHAVELSLPSELGAGNLKLQRDLKQAIREYAPGSEIVADKRIWRSDGVSFYSDVVRTREYRICEECNHLQMSRDVGMPLVENEDKSCPICGHKPKGKKRNVEYIIPDGFFAAQKDNGKPARQYVRREKSIMRSALIPEFNSEGEESPTPLISHTYDRDGKLLYVNEGTGTGFHVRLSGTYRGAIIKDKKEQKNVNPVTLGHTQNTDTLHLRFHGASSITLPPPQNQAFWLSLMYALIQGASRALQIERNDIDGVLYPRRVEGSQHWEQTIVLYDNVPGGAGHVQQIRDELSAVVRQALQIANCTDCAPESSCYHCLRDYNNQAYHHLLKRDEVIRYLEALLASFNNETQALSGICEVVAIDKALWLYRQLESAKHAVYLAANTLTLQAPLGVTGTWADLIQDLLNRGVKVTLKLGAVEIDKHNPETLSVAKHLQLLIERGMHLERITQLPDWHVIIDPSQITARAIQLAPTWSLDAHPTDGQTALFTCSTESSVSATLAQFNARSGKVITHAELNPPPTVEVINYVPWRAGFNGNETEQDLFGKVFAAPIVKLLINDRYLHDDERILNRVRTYIEMANAHGTLQSVDIRTNRAGANYSSGSADVQKRAFEKLSKHYPSVKISPKYGNAEHDRYIHITRQDGSQARIVIGQGLDFIRSNEANTATYIVIQDPL